MNAPLPPNEGERLRALRRYAILNTPPEAGFDRITRLAARLLKVPVALVSLVDENRQWFKSCYGFDGRETSRELSFCAHAILADGLTVVPDVTLDPRFADNLLVTGAPGVRFYAGAPLKSSDDHSLGTLCVLDVVSRELNAEEQATLGDLAAMVADELELRLAIRERSQQAAAIVNLSSGVLVTDPNEPDSPITFSNPGFSAMTGYGPEEVLGRNCRFLQGPETNQMTVAGMREAIAARRIFQGVILNYRKDGTPFWNELTIGPVFDSNGALVNFVGLQSDVTERKRTFDQLRDNFERLQKLERLRDNLTTMIIHDLRTPLTTVIGFIDLLLFSARQKLGTEEVDYVETAKKGARTLQDMITSLLDVTRLEAGEMPLDLRQTDVTEVVRQATEGFISVADGRSFVRDLPAATFARCDADLIRRVVENLVNNAFKFTPAKGEVRVTVLDEGVQARISVKDTGPGVPREYQARIFEKFGQMEGSRRRHSSGLGLTFCKLAVEAHGGTIGIESEAGKGSTFWFVIPNLAPK